MLPFGPANAAHREAHRSRVPEPFPRRMLTTTGSIARSPPGKRTSPAQLQVFPSDQQRGTGGKESFPGVILRSSACREVYARGKEAIDAGKEAISRWIGSSPGEIAVCSGEVVCFPAALPAFPIELLASPTEPLTFPIGQLVRSLEQLVFPVGQHSIPIEQLGSSVGRLILPTEELASPVEPLSFPVGQLSSSVECGSLRRKFSAGTAGSGVGAEGGEKGGVPWHAPRGVTAWSLRGRAGPVRSAPAGAWASESGRRGAAGGRTRRASPSGCQASA